MTLRKADTREEGKKLAKKFNSKSELWRIEAVIHDGNWYDIEKWKKVAKVKDISTIEKWIEDNKDKVIKSDLDSYRVNHDNIVSWYAKQGLDPKESIVPKNFPPKLWGKTTETDAFLSAPRRRVGTISFQTPSEEVYKRCAEVLKGVGKIMPDEAGRYKAYGLSAAHMKNLLSKGLTEEEFKSLDIKTRSILLQRELIDLPSEWLSDSLYFYTKVFAPSILKSSMPTIEIYLPHQEDIHSQIVLWVITAMKKFDEEASVPFSGYLNNVLRHWPYDLPNEFLGKDLAKFQRDRKKAIEKAKEKINDDIANISIDVLANIMELSKEEYMMLNSEHESWLSERNATTLVWEDSSNEKKGTLLGYSGASEPENCRSKYNLSQSVIKAGLETEDWSSANFFISQIGEIEFPEDIKEKLSPKFLASFAKLLGIG